MRRYIVDGRCRHRRVRARGRLSEILGLTPARSAAAGNGHRAGFTSACVASIQFDREPLWAYGFETPAKPGDKASPQAPPSRNLRPNEDPAEQTRPRRVAGSRTEYSLVDVRDTGNVVDWFPGDHPPMSELMVRGPAAIRTTSRGCGSCHLPNGKGRPENAPVAGLPVSYFIRQIQDFRSGLRRSADPRKPNTNTMIDYAKAMTDDEVKEAAEYFGAIKWTPWIRVVETEMVPKTRIVGNLFLAPTHERTEPIAGRIIEVPEDMEQGESAEEPEVGVRRLRAARQPRKGEGPRDHRRDEGHRKYDRARQDHGLHHVPWGGPDGRGRRAAHCRAIAELHHETAVGHSAGHAATAQPCS